MNDLLTQVREQPLLLPILIPTAAAASVIIIGMLIGAVRNLITKFIFRLTGNKKLTLLIMNYVTFPGTVIHELSHALFATMTGAKVTEISFFPKGDTLGHVNYITNGGILAKRIQLSLTSCAPVITGLIIQIPVIWAAEKGYFDRPLIMAVVIYTDISIITHADMSRTDLSNYIRGLKILLPAAWLFAIMFTILK